MMIYLILKNSSPIIKVVADLVTHIEATRGIATNR